MESQCYILKDHLGSWTTITDEVGRLEQELSYDALNDKIKYGADLFFGGLGFAPGRTAISTFWFFGGRELVFQYGNTMGELLKDGINPGYPVYQPFK